MSPLMLIRLLFFRTILLLKVYIVFIIILIGTNGSGILEIGIDDVFLQ